MPYHDKDQPAVFIGMYSEADIKAVRRHKGHAVVKWCGYDSMMVEKFRVFKRKNIINVSVHPNVVARLKLVGVECRLVRPYLVNDNIYQGRSGEAVFAYCPPTSNDYHRPDLIGKLRRQFKIIKGDGSIPQQQWHDGKKYDVYNRCYIGLVLNDYAGGLATVTELLLQGKYCVTNIADLPNCLKWETIKDIRVHLRNPKYRHPDPLLANNLDFTKFEPEWLNLIYNERMSTLPVYI